MKKMYILLKKSKSAHFEKIFVTNTYFYLKKKLFCITGLDISDLVLISYTEWKSIQKIKYFFCLKCL